MAFTPTMLIVTALTVVGLVLGFTNSTGGETKAGWWLLAAFVALIVAGNVAEKVITGTSPIFR